MDYIAIRDCYQKAKTIAEKSKCVVVMAHQIPAPHYHYSPRPDFVDLPMVSFVCVDYIPLITESYPTTNKKMILDLEAARKIKDAMEIVIMVADYNRLNEDVVIPKPAFALLKNMHEQCVQMGAYDTMSFKLFNPEMVTRNPEINLKLRHKGEDSKYTDELDSDTTLTTLSTTLRDYLNAFFPFDEGSEIEVTLTNFVGNYCTVTLPGIGLEIGSITHQHRMGDYPITFKIII